PDLARPAHSEHEGDERRAERDHGGDALQGPERERDRERYEDAGAARRQRGRRRNRGEDDDLGAAIEPDERNLGGHVPRESAQREGSEELECEHAESEHASGERADADAPAPALVERAGAGENHEPGEGEKKEAQRLRYRAGGHDRPQRRYDAPDADRGEERRRRREAPKLGEDGAPSCGQRRGRGE